LKTDFCESTEGRDLARETKPPLGLRPQYVAELQRVQEICDAIIRYKEAAQVVPGKWIEELARLVSE
jgi:hypothetical protein